MDRFVEGETDRRIYRCQNRLIDRCTDGERQIGVQMAKQIDRWTYVQMEKQRQMYKWQNRQKDGHMYRWRNRQLDGQME